MKDWRPKLERRPAALLVCFVLLNFFLPGRGEAQKATNPKGVQEKRGDAR